MSAVPNAFRELAPEVAIDKPVTMRQLVASSMGRERMVALLAGFFALLTLALTGIGLCGVLNYGVVTRRNRDRRPDGFGRDSGRNSGNDPVGVKPLDPWICAASLAVLLATAVIACILPPPSRSRRSHDRPAP